MQGKTVVITGATSGIGEVAAVRLAEQGARIVFTARDKARADDTMAALAQGQSRRRPRHAHGRSFAALGNEAGGGRTGARAADRRADQQCRRPVQQEAGNRGRAGDDLRAQSHGLFRDHQPAAGQAEARRAHRQRGIQRPSRRQARFRRPAIAQGLCRLSRLCQEQALQHPVQSRTGAADRGKPASPPMRFIPALSPRASATIPAD